MALTRVVLDTSAYAWLQRGHPELAAVVFRAAWVGLPTVAAGELRAGFELGNRREQNERELEAFLAGPPVELLPVDDAVTQRYARMFAALRRAGTPLPTNDVWIAATAAGTGGKLLSFDRDFDRIAGLDHLRFEPG